MKKLLTVKQVAARTVYDTGYMLWVFIAAVMVITSYIAVYRNCINIGYTMMCGSAVFNGALTLALLGERLELKAWARIFRPEDKTYN